MTLPPLDKVAAALRDTTDILARELTLPTGQLPAWDNFEWCVARAVATMQGVAPLLLKKIVLDGPSELAPISP